MENANQYLMKMSSNKIKLILEFMNYKELMIFSNTNKKNKKLANEILAKESNFKICQDYYKTLYECQQNDKCDINCELLNKIFTDSAILNLLEFFNCDDCSSLQRKCMLVECYSCTICLCEGCNNMISCENCDDKLFCENCKNKFTCDYCEMLLCGECLITCSYCEMEICYFCKNSENCIQCRGYVCDYPSCFTYFNDYSIICSNCDNNEKCIFDDSPDNIYVFVENECKARKS